MFGCRSRSAWTWWKARRWSPPPQHNASSRSAPSAAVRRTWSRPATTSSRKASWQGGLVEIYCYYHMRANENPPDDEAASESRLRNVDRACADAPLHQPGPSAKLARFHGVRQRHRRRHVHPHVRHDAVDARPRLAAARQFDRRHPRGKEQQREHHRHANGDFRLSATCKSSGSIAPGASAPIRSIHGARRSTATKAR